MDLSLTKGKYRLKAFRWVVTRPQRFLTAPKKDSHTLKCTVSHLWVTLQAKISNTFNRSRLTWTWQQSTSLRIRYLAARRKFNKLFRLQESKPRTRLKRRIRTHEMESFIWTNKQASQLATTISIIARTSFSQTEKAFNTRSLIISSSLIHKEAIEAGTLTEIGATLMNRLLFSITSRRSKKYP